MRRYYLAYGMNTNLDSMKMRCPDAKSLGKVLLRDHSLAFKGCCDIIHSPGYHMECVLWTITDKCEASLDILEGYPSFYTKKEVPVRHKNDTVRAMIYYMRDTHKLNYPSKSYLDMVTEGYESHNITLKQIVDALDNIESKYEYHSWN